MRYNLSKSGAQWAVEISGADDLAPEVKKFKERGAAEKWMRGIAKGDIAPPVLKPKKATKPAAKKAPAKAKKAPAKK